MKICVIAARYGISGVPLAQFRLARAFANLGHEVELIFGTENSGTRIPNSSNFKVLSLKKDHVKNVF
jgi:hypothetical protein